MILTLKWAGFSDLALNLRYFYPFQKLLLKRVTGSEHGKQGNEKWEQNIEMENEVTDRT